MTRKLIVFDLDGVLFDSVKVANDYILDLFPTATEQTVKDMHEGNYHEAFAKLKLTHKLKIETDDEKQLRLSTYTMKKSESPLYDGMSDLLKTLRDRGYLLAVNTSAREHNTLPLLEKSGMLGLFDIIATADMSKSKVEKFNIFEEKYKLEKKDMLFVTDTLGDVLEAEVAKVPTVAVTWGVHDEAYFMRDKHEYLTFIVNSVGGLEAFIFKYFQI